MIKETLLKGLGLLAAHNFKAAQWLQAEIPKIEAWEPFVVAQLKLLKPFFDIGRDWLAKDHPHLLELFDLASKAANLLVE